MPASDSPFPTTRREFLRYGASGVGLLAFGRFAPSFLVQSCRAQTPAPGRDQPVLVLVQLAGGNDGLNTVVPFEDDHYHRLRPTLAINPDQLLKLDDLHGLHPACTDLEALFHEGKLGIVQNVGYPNPNRSHFRSTEIWETGSASNAYLDTGWVGRYLDNTCSGTPANDPAAIHLTDELPQTYCGKHDHGTFGLSSRKNGRRRKRENLALLEKLTKSLDAHPGRNESFLQSTILDALVTERRVERILNNDRPEIEYPGTPFARQLRNVAALIASGLPTRVYYVSLGGFDTHARQANRHAALMRTLSKGLGAFQRDLGARKLDSQVLTMTFSEFGRRPMENESGGTDHGTAAPLLIMGDPVKGGIYGMDPDLDLKRNRDLKFTTDFRQVYATTLDLWMGSDSQTVLDGSFEPIPCLRA